MKLGKLKSGAAMAAGWVPDALMVGGAASVSYGAWLVFAPAGFAVGGLLALAAGWLMARSGR